MVRFRIQGTQPERALLRLKRAKIGVYSIKKPQKTELIFSVKSKDAEKVFSIYPNALYNKNGYSPFYAEKIGEYGVSALWKRIKRRTGLIVGALLFCIVTLFSNTLVLGVKVSGATEYFDEVQRALAEKGVKLFSVYQSGKEDEICATLLRLPSVEFCSVTKRGLFVKVDLRLSNFTQREMQRGDMLSFRSGIVTSITVMKGTALKSVGDRVEMGEPLVGGYIQTPSGEREDTCPVARVQIACTQEKEYEVISAEEAFAQAYLEAVNGGEITVYEKAIEKTERGYLARLSYTVIQSVNL